MLKLKGTLVSKGDGDPGVGSEVGSNGDDGEISIDDDLSSSSCEMSVNKSSEEDIS